MTRLIVAAALCFILVALPAQTLAVNTWCYTNHPDAIVCDDFDRYCCLDDSYPTCTAPPPENEACDPALIGGDIRDQWAMWDVWDGWHNCGWTPAVHDDSEYCSSYPYCAKIGCAAFNNELGYGNRSVTNPIKAKFGAQYSKVLAADLTPLTIEYALNGRTGNKIYGANVYVELGDGRGGPQLPGPNSITNYVQGEDCKLCGATIEHSIFPRLCRQSPAPPRSPLQSRLTRAAWSYAGAVTNSPFTVWPAAWACQA